MKTRTLIVAGMMLAGITVGSNAQSYFSSTPINGSAQKARIVRNYLACLASDNEGTVESALAHIAALKLNNPRVDLSGFDGTEVGFDRLDTLWLRGGFPGCA